MSLSTACWILHRRPWQESSVLIEAFSLDHGRVGLVARGARSERSQWRGLVEPFTLLSISFVQRGELGTVRDLEPLGDRHRLEGDALWCGLYANELLLMLIDRQEALPAVFDAYGALVTVLSQDVGWAAGLRRFEWVVLNALGVAPSLYNQGDGSSPIALDGRYQLRPETGFEVGPEGLGVTVDGSTIAWLSQDAPVEASPDVLSQAKQMMRALIDHQLAGRRLRTREMMRQMR